MPVLHRLFQGEAKKPDGTTQKVAPQVALVVGGPRVQVAIGVPSAIAQALLEKGEALPPPVLGDALIDTGASISCIDIEAALALQLPEVGKAVMQSASHANHETSLYPFRISLQGMPIEFGTERAMGAQLKNQGLVAPIGRDILASSILFYNGITGEITFGI